jgi:phosphopantothenoylcysteine decarboxylase / phosphopantothenate---cysteine ligase
MRVLLGIGGGIAAYKSPDLVRNLRRAGHEVRCVLTSSGSHLVASAALAAVSGAKVHETLWSDDGSMPHIDLARWAEGLLVAPATADLMAHLALGLAGDLLTTLFLAFEPELPVWIAPAMNTVMWNKPVVQGHVATLRTQGARIIAPVAGELACGEEGVGAMAAAEVIVAALATPARQ